MPALEKPRLSELQQWMRWVLTHPAGAGHVLDGCASASPKGWRRGPQPKPWVETIGETPQVKRADRLAIYGDGYFLRLIDCLGSNFSSVKNVVGEKKFFDLAKSYLVEYPSTTRCIDNVGHRFASFIRQSASARTYRFLPELAHLEWTFHEAFFADDIPLLDRRRLTNLTEAQWKRATVRMDAAVKLLRCCWPVDELWRADGKPSHAKRIRPKSVRIMLFRNATKAVRALRLEKPEFDLFERLAKGWSIGRALAASRGLSAKKVESLFAEWMSLDLIRDVYIS